MDRVKCRGDRRGQRHTINDIQERHKHFNTREGKQEEHKEKGKNWNIVTICLPLWNLHSQW